MKVEQVPLHVGTDTGFPTLVETIVISWECYRKGKEHLAKKCEILELINDQGKIKTDILLPKAL